MLIAKAAGCGAMRVAVVLFGAPLWLCCTQVTKPSKQGRARKEQANNAQYAKPTPLRFMMSRKKRISSTFGGKRGKWDGEEVCDGTRTTELDSKLELASWRSLSLLPRSNLLLVAEMSSVFMISASNWPLDTECAKTLRELARPRSKMALPWHDVNSVLIVISETWLYFLRGSNGFSRPSRNSELSRCQPHAHIVRTPHPPPTHPSPGTLG